MKSKLLALAAVALFAAVPAQAANMGDGNVFDMFYVPPANAYSVPYAFTLTAITSLNATAIAEYSDTPNADFNFVDLVNTDTDSTVASFAFSNILTEYQFTNLAIGNYSYYVFGHINASGSTPVEITFTSAPVPEPETYAMLLAGLGVLGFAARRRKTA